MRKHAFAQVQITVHPSVETPFGEVFWNPERAGTATIIGGIGAVAGLFLGACMGLDFDSGLCTAFLSLATSVTTGLAATINHLRVS